VLLPSPLLGPAVWAAVARKLEQQGRSTTVCAVPARPTTAQDVLAAFLRSLPADRPLVLVPHSNAGLFVPRLCQERRVVANVFVDAALPPAEGSTALAPTGLYDFLETRADQRGQLPPWTQWWEGPDVDELFPDQVIRKCVEAEQPRLPLAYFRSSLSAPPGWVDTPSAYVAFGDTYADERRQAETWGWPTTTLAGRHLHMLVDPDGVAATVAALLRVHGL
jgi:hypothetical protein